MNIRDLDLKIDIIKRIFTKLSRIIEKILLEEREHKEKAYNLIYKNAI